MIGHVLARAAAGGCKLGPLPGEAVEELPEIVLEAALKAADGAAGGVLATGVDWVPAGY